MVFAPVLQVLLQIPDHNTQIKTVWKGLFMNAKNAIINFFEGEKPGTEQDEVKLQIASKQIVQTAILRAVQQVSQESQQKEKRTNTGTSLQLERGKLTKKHEKKGLQPLFQTLNQLSLIPVDSIPTCEERQAGVQKTRLQLGSLTSLPPRATRVQDVPVFLS
ncbi:A-kinase anchor protein inhibitor 1 isoform X2 [Taeniopygia guttata]|uniref:A-kinase anchor protein inhibitor 1 isoform X2 n=1 Tax=Taeniopygia guttata TaxID=59729 RepID=UPI003BB96132